MAEMQPCESPRTKKDENRGFYNCRIVNVYLKEERKNPLLVFRELSEKE